MMDRQLFDKAIGEVPPSTVDVDAVIARERRAAWVRRVANPWVATAAGVVALSFGIAVAVFPPGSGETGLSWGIPPTGRSSTTPVKAPPYTPSCVPAPTEPAADTKQRLTEVLNTRVRNHLPAGADLVPNPGAQDPIGTQRGPLEVYDVEGAGPGNGACRGDDGYLLAMANVARGKELGNLTAIVASPDAHGVWAPDCAGNRVDPSETSCGRTTGPRGEIIVASTHDNEGGSTSYRVDLAKPDGTYLSLIAENVADTAKKGGAPQSPAPPLTLEQLIVIGLDPAITLYP